MAEKPPGEKTEAPTPRRLAEARRKGERARSRELAMAGVMLGGALWLALGGGAALAGALGEALRLAFAAAGEADRFAPAQAAAAMLGLVAWPMLGLFATCVLGALVGGFALGGGGFAIALAAPKWARLDPIRGLGRMFGAQGLIELGKALIKLLAVATVAGVAAWSLLDDALGMAAADPAGAARLAGGRAAWLLLALAGALALVGLVDAPIALARHLKQLRMTRQEVRDELKEQEGRPEVKAAQRRRRFEARRGSLRAATAGADLVVTNPAEFAVALRYRRELDIAPVIVARGRGELAAVIRAAAAEAGVPRLAYPGVARALYFTGRTGQPIHPDLYPALAAILAFVHATARPGARPPLAPEVEPPESLRFDAEGRREGRQEPGRAGLGDAARA
jgi:flagellar biosynthetic protein FlhB